MGFLKTKSVYEGPQDLIKIINSSIGETVLEFHRGFQRTMDMYTVAFYLGVVIIIVSLGYAILGGNNLISIAFGAVGLLDILTFLVTKPPQSLENSRADLAQLQIAYTNWFSSVNNWNAYIREKNAELVNIANRGAIYSETLKILYSEKVDNETINRIDDAVKNLIPLQMDTDALKKVIIESDKALFAITAETIKLIQEYCENKNDEKKLADQSKNKNTTNTSPKETSSGVSTNTS